MNISTTALKIWTVRKFTSHIKSCAQFHNTWKTEAEFLSFYDELTSGSTNDSKFTITGANLDDMLHHLSVQADDMTHIDGVLCCFDDDFPVIDTNTTKGDRPYLLFYKGDPTLLDNLNRNIAVIGHTMPSESLIARERHIVQKLVDHDMVIVSGLAKGCDAVSHEVCVANGGKTVAILPNPLDTITPAVHRKLAQRIIESGGLLITEYDGGPVSRTDAINRFVERDRLQALFSKAVILIASFATPKDGDAGSRHAMGKSHKYGHLSCVMYDPTVDSDAKDMGLNRLLLSENKAKQLVTKGGTSDSKRITIQELVAIKNQNLEQADTLF